MRPTLVVAAAIVVVSLLGYPLTTVADGRPRFPTRDECVHEAVTGEPVDLVYGRFDDPVAAEQLLERVLEVGFAGTELIFDGCGHWEVVLEDVPSIDIGREVQREAATVDLHPWLERASGD